jgi:hypothetical protein
MTIFLVCISIMFIGLGILWRLVSINTPDLPTQARARGVVLPKNFVGPTYRNTGHSGPHFWSEDEP